MGVTTRRAILQQNPRRVSFEVIVLPVAQRPETGRKPCRAKTEGDGDENNQDIHQRTAFKTTRIDEEDITAAAISGVAKPMTATGIATAL